MWKDQMFVFHVLVQNKDEELAACKNKAMMKENINHAVQYKQ